LGFADPIGGSTYIYDNCSPGLYLPLHYEVWLCLLATFLLGTASLFAYTRLLRDKAEFNLDQGVSFLWALLVLQAEFNSITMRTNGVRLFFVTFSCMMFIVGSSYSGTLISFLTTQVRFSLVLLPIN
jgi:hypothetical protein